jgi:HPt (histidine-containing phosphotransfer) domain-containing protein
MVHFADEQAPIEALSAVATIRAAGGEELVRGVVGAFNDFAAAQAAWLDRQVASGAFEGVAHGARALRVSAAQLGVLDVVKACELAELAGEGEDAVALSAAVDAVHDALAAARPWMDALAAG